MDMTTQELMAQIESLNPEDRLRIAQLALDTIEEAVQRIVNDPTSFEVVDEDLRRCRVPRFPFCLHFRAIE